MKTEPREPARAWYATIFGEFTEFPTRDARDAAVAAERERRDAARAASFVDPDEQDRNGGEGAT